MVVAISSLAMKVLKQQSISSSQAQSIFHNKFAGYNVSLRILFGTQITFFNINLKNLISLFIVDAFELTDEYFPLLLLGFWEIWVGMTYYIRFSFNMNDIIELVLFGANCHCFHFAHFEKSVQSVVLVTSNESRSLLHIRNYKVSIHWDILLSVNKLNMVFDLSWKFISKAALLYVSRVVQAISIL